jgi:hypothetical protein
VLNYECAGERVIIIITVNQATETALKKKSSALDCDRQSRQFSSHYFKHTSVIQ